MTKSTLIEFPCYFPVKIMGVNTPLFLEEISEITMKHFPDTKPENIIYKLSSNANYLAITVTVYATSQDLLDNYYRNITQHPLIKMVL